MSIRVCLDCRALNLNMKNIVEDALDSPSMCALLARFKYRSLLDLASAFQQINLHEESRKYVTFKWKNKTYEWLTVPFGIKVISSFFQLLMLQILGGLDFVAVYIDNLYIYSNSYEEHRKHVKSVIAFLNRYNLRLQPKKFEFCVYDFSMLGRRVVGHSVTVDPTKLGVISNARPPRTYNELVSFLGMTTYLRIVLSYLLASPTHTWSLPRRSTRSRLLRHRQQMEQISPGRLKFERERGCFRLLWLHCRCRAHFPPRSCQVLFWSLVVTLLQS